MKRYSIKVALRGISPMIWRRLRILGQTSIAEFHHIIQTCFGWDDEYLHLFHIYGKDYGVYHDGGMSFSDNPYEVPIDNFDFDVGDKFYYEYNFFEHNIVDVRVEQITLASTEHLPCCTAGTGMPGYTKSDETSVMLKLLEAIVEMKKAKAITKISEKVRDLAEQFDAIKFNRKKINKLLAEKSYQED